MSRLAILTLLIAAGTVTANPAAAQNSDRAATMEAMRSARGWIGVSFVSASPPARGLVVEAVSADAPAERAGVAPGDTIVMWNGSTDVLAAARSTTLSPGDTVTLRIRRDGQPERELTLVAETRPSRLFDAESAERLRQTLAEMSRNLETQSDRIRIQADSLRAWLDDRLAMRFDSLATPDSVRREMVERIREWRGMLADSIQWSTDSLRVRMSRVQQMDADRHHQRERFLDSLRSTDARSLAEALRDLGNAEEARMAIMLARGREALAGAETTSLNPGLASYFGVEEGVLVLRVAPETPAATAGLREGDVIVAAEGAAVSSLGPLRRRIVAARDGIELEVVREGQRLTIVIGR